jgi:hypothetical protein
MTDDGAVTTSPPTPTEDTPSVWEDFIDIFYAPAAVFERRRGQSPWPVLVTLTIVMVVLFLAWQRSLGPVMAAEMQRAMAENPNVSSEQMEQFGSVGRIFAVIGFAVSFPVSVLLVALTAWVLVRLFDAKTGFLAILMVAAYSQIVRIAQFVVGLLQGLLMDVNRMDSVHDVSIGAARFLDQPESSAMLVNLAARVDLFTLWATALIAIGVRVVARLPRASAWTVAVLVWLIGAVPTVIGALMS